MQDLSGRRERRRASLLSLQVQWEYQICPPGLFDGVAIPLAEKALRALQDAVPIYEAVRPRYAQGLAGLRFYEPHDKIHFQEHASLAEGCLGC